MIFWCILGFSLLVFYWEFLHRCSWVWLVCNSLFCWVFVWLWYQGNCSFIKKVWQWLFCFYYMKHTKEYRYQLFLKVLGEFSIKTIWSCVFYCCCCCFLVGKFLMTVSISSGLICLFKLFTWLLFNFGIWYLSKKCPFFSHFLI